MVVPSSRQQRNLDYYKSISHLRKGNCSHALNFSFMYTPSYRSESLYSFIPDGFNASVKVINIGAGTTGTRDLARLMCKEFSISTLHFTAACNTKYHGVAEQFAPLKWYLNVTAQDFLIHYEKALLEAVARYEYLTDDPYAQILPFVMSAVPNISVLATLRDPLIWARRRKEQHANAVMCHSSLWTHPDVLHPFDFLGCLQAVGKNNMVGDAVVTLHNINERMLAEAFVQYNTVSFHQVLSTSRPFKVFCFWNPPSKQFTAPKLTSMLKEFWKSSTLTSEFLTRKQDLSGSNLKTNRNLLKFDFGNTNLVDNGNSNNITPGENYSFTLPHPPFLIKSISNATIFFITHTTFWISLLLFICLLSLIVSRHI